MNDYKLTFTVTFKGQDDPAARAQAAIITAAIDREVAGADIKLQQVYPDRPPRKVNL
ncbi:MAG: hypothetical protein RQ723_07150 [Desulfuromonadales bacterium]|nr:hypothetical protein [Desulfuromonadales bacterium]